MSFFKKIFSSSGTGSGIKGEGRVEKHPTARITDSTITVGRNAKLSIGPNVRISGYRIHITEGELVIAEHSILERGANPGIPAISIEKGSLNISHHALLRCDITIRFGGKCSIGQYTGIMEASELRVDEQLIIGDFNMISYECMIYDTNTHKAYAPEIRRKMTIKDFPSMGAESEKPETKPVSIGNDCWIGKRAVVLKGVTVGDQSTVAACDVVTGNIPAGSIAYGNPTNSRPKDQKP